MRLRFPETTFQHDRDLAILSPFGGDINKPVGPGCERLAFQNGNGIERWPNPAEDVFDAATQYDIGLCGIAEPNCAMDENLTAAMEIAAKKRFGCGIVSAASTPGTKKTGYLPGGILQLARGSIGGRHEKRGYDKMGNFTWMTLRGRNKKKLCVITAYRVCQIKGSKPSSPDSNTSYWQQVQLMIKHGIEEPDPRNQVLKDLTTVIRKKREEGCEVILMMDANESTNDPRGKFSTFIQDNLLHDIHAQAIRELPPTTRVRSPSRIDFMLATEGVLEFVREAGYLALHEGLVSDHIMLWIEMDMKSFFGGEGPSIVPPQSREFSFDNIEMREKFLRELNDIHQHQAIPDRIRRLEIEYRLHGSSAERVQRYNELDREIIESIKAASRRTVKQKQHGHARSPALSRAGNEVLFWKSVLSSKRNDIPITSRAEVIARRNDMSFDEATAANRKEADDNVKRAWA